MEITQLLKAYQDTTYRPKMSDQFQMTGNLAPVNRSLHMPEIERECMIIALMSLVIVTSTLQHLSGHGSQSK